MLTFPVGEALSAEQITRMQTLPRKPDPVTLEGTHVRLVPLDVARDAAPLHRVSNGQPATVGERRVGAYDPEMLVWRYLAVGPFADATALSAFLQTLVDAENGRCLCVVDVPTGHPVGVVNYMSNFPEHLKVELGNIWYSPVVQRTKASLESTYLLLAHAFALGYRRVEWKCDALNERSRRSALRMGFRFEGIQEAHYIIKGRNRDTAWYRILDHEWDDVRRQLETMLAE